MVNGTYSLIHGIDMGGRLASLEEKKNAGLGPGA